MNIQQEKVAQGNTLEDGQTNSKNLIQINQQIEIALTQCKLYGKNSQQVDLEPQQVQESAMNRKQADQLGHKEENPDRNTMYLFQHLSLSTHMMISIRCQVFLFITSE